MCEAPDQGSGVEVLDDGDAKFCQVWSSRAAVKSIPEVASRRRYTETLKCLQALERLEHVKRGGRIPGVLEFRAGKAIRRRVCNYERRLGIGIEER